MLAVTGTLSARVDAVVEAMARLERLVEELVRRLDAAGYDVRPRQNHGRADRPR
jgi:hypothetical protein